jgi:8-oxo-dGTP diphosphatase
VIPSEPSVQIAVAVVVADGRVLVGRRAIDARDAAGRAEFPGGKVEAGESPVDAAARECFEETGVSVRIGAEMGIATAGSSRGPIEIRFYKAEPVGPAAVRPPFAWLPIAALAGLPFPAANASVVARLIAESRIG